MEKLTRGLAPLLAVVCAACAGNGEPRETAALSPRRAPLPLRLVAPPLTAPLTERLPAPARPTDIIQRAVFERINRDRAEARLSPVAWDEAAARVARAYCTQQIRERTKGHFLMDGLPPYARTGFAGVFGMQSENTVSWQTTATRFHEAPASMALQGHEQMMAEKPPRDGHRQTILDPDATHVGVGYALERGEFRMAQEFLTRDLAALRIERGPTRRFSVLVRGAVLPPRRIQFVTFGWEPPPRAISREQANGKTSYSYAKAARAFVPEGDRRSRIVGATTEPRLRLRPSREFSLRFAPERPGLWTMVFHTAASSAGRARPGGSATVWVE